MGRSRKSRPPVRKCPRVRGVVLFEERKRAMLEREGWTNTYRTDVPASRVFEFKNAASSSRSEALYGAGEDAGMLALFGSPSRFEGRDVTGWEIGSTGKVPYPLNASKSDIDWDKTEDYTKAPITEIDPRGLTATQHGLVNAGLRHYMNNPSGELFSPGRNSSNQFPVVMETDDGERRIMTGHHRLTAGLLRGEPVRGRIIKGVKKNQSGT